MVGTEELALKSKGCIVSFATSSSSSFDDSSNVIDGQRSTHWCTTGSYPQAFILSFPNTVFISSVKMRSYLVQLISVEKSLAETAQGFEEVCSKELEVTDHCHQVESLHSSEFSARHLRFTVQSGYDHICAIYKVEVQGSFQMLHSGGQLETSTLNAHSNDTTHKLKSTEYPQNAMKESPMWIEEEEDDDDDKDETINYSASLKPLHSSDEDEEH